MSSQYKFISIKIIILKIIIIVRTIKSYSLKVWLKYMNKFYIVIVTEVLKLG